MDVKGLISQQELACVVIYKAQVTYDNWFDLAKSGKIRYRATLCHSITEPGYIQSPSCDWVNFSRSGFQPQHLISWLKTAPTFLVLALSI